MFKLNEGLWFYIVNNLKLIDSEFEYIMLTAGFAVIALIAGYLLGSVNSAIIVSKVLYGDDVRRHGSGNAGLTNTLRTYGKRAALLTLFGDVMKTVIAVFIGAILGGFGYSHGISLGTLYCDLPLSYMAGFAAVIGHILPIFYKFKGGKGVLCTATLALVLTPFEFLILILIFIAVVAYSKYVSLGSVIVACLYPVVVSLHIKVLFNGAKQNGVMALITVLIAIIVVYCHRENLKRINDRTERKLSFGKKKEDK